MGWERRKGGSGQYYTRSRRVHGRVRREYFGCGDVAQLAAETDATLREARAARRQLRAERQREERTRHDEMYAAILGPLDALDAMCRMAMRRELEAAGYHQHDRGEWRKRRGATGQEGKKGAAARTSAGCGAGSGVTDSDVDT